MALNNKDIVLIIAVPVQSMLSAVRQRCSDVAVEDL